MAMALWISPWAARRAYSCSRIYPRRPPRGDRGADAKRKLTIAWVGVSLGVERPARLAGLWPRQSGAEILSANADQYEERIEADSSVDVLHAAGGRAIPAKPIHPAGGERHDVSFL